jgi:hypothetical protein
MLKIILGYFLSFIGFVFLLLFLMMALFDAKTNSEIITYLVISLPFGYMVYKGIKLIRKNVKGRMPAPITAIDPSEILVEFEISGRPWEAFQEDKCSPTKNLVLSIISSLVIGGVSYFFLTYSLQHEGADYPELISGITTTILVVFLYYLYNKMRYQVYGRLNKLTHCKVIISRTHIDFGGELIPLNYDDFFVTAAKISQDDFYNKLIIHRDNYNRRKFLINILVVPFPDNKMEEIKAITENLKDRIG